MKKLLKAVIVDDEQHGAKALTLLLKAYCTNVKVVGITKSVAEAIKCVNKHQPDIVFLDIEMPVENGFELLKQVEKPSFEVIFTTAYDHYALKAIKHNAIDYLLKPIDADELQEAVAKAERKRLNPTESFEKIERLLNDITNSKKSRKLLVSTMEGISFIEPNNIVRLEADSNYTNIYTDDGRKFITSKTLKDYEDNLEHAIFFRIHHAHLININFIDKYLKGNGGFITMSDGITLEVSRRKKMELLNLLSKV